MTPDEELRYAEWAAVHFARQEYLLELVAADWRQRMAEHGYRLTPPRTVHRDS